jgi:tetratricopeptide (TPR) repeat protein
MMITTSRNLLFTALVFVLTACSSPSKLTQKAAELERVKSYSEAASLYAKAVKKEPTFIPAKNGLARTSKIILQDKLSDFSNYLSAQNKEQALAAYMDAEKYQRYIASFGIKQNIPLFQTEAFNKAKTLLLSQWYDEATTNFDNKNFRAAENLFSKILQLSPNYKNSNQLLNASQLEPLYISGTLAFNSKRFREAYYYFVDIVNKDVSYKNSEFLLQESLKLGKITVAILPFYNTTRSRNISHKFSAYLLTSLANSQDPFIQIVDRANIDLILREVDFGLSGFIEESSAVQMGKLLGAKVAVTGKVLEYRPQQSALGKTKIKAFEKRVVSAKDPNTGEIIKTTTYIPTNYFAFSQENKVFMSVQYQLTSLETGVVLASEIVNETMVDFIDYIDYKGDRRNLHPDYNNKADTNQESCEALRARTNGKKHIASISELNTQLQQVVGELIAQHIEEKLTSI